MTPRAALTFETPAEGDLGLRRIANESGVSLSVLPNGSLFAIEHQHERGRIMINQVLGSPLDGGIARLYLRIRAPEPAVAQAIGPGAEVSFGAAADRFTWKGATRGMQHKVSLWLHPQRMLWLWRVEVANTVAQAVACDAILVQDVGLGDRGFLMNNEAYASQYIDHHVARHPRCGPVVMSRQNLTQSSGHPWVAHGCFEGTSGFATDAMQLLGPPHRDSDEIDPRLDLPTERLQHEVACPTIQAEVVDLAPGARAAWTFFGLYEPDHAEASSDADLSRIDAAQQSAGDFSASEVVPSAPVQSVLQKRVTDRRSIRFRKPRSPRRYPERSHEERADGLLLSFFTPDGTHNRHVVLRDKERIVRRRHGTILRTGQGMLPDETTMCATCWMHGVFAAQLTVGNTSFHKLFSVSRDPYNITRSSGLRILIDEGGGWRLLAVPSVFEIGLSDCRWIYHLGERTVTVRALAAGDAPAMQWRIAVEGKPCRFLVFGHLVLGERELDHAGRIEIDAARKRFAFRPDPKSLWGRRYPDAVYLLVTSTPDAIEAVGGDALLYADGEPRKGPYVAMRTQPTSALCFAVVGSLDDPAEAERLAATYQSDVADSTMLEPAARYWSHVTRDFRVTGGPEVAAQGAIVPWLAHNAMLHLTVPHGLEQYTGAAWGTRDVCQGPVEFLLSLEHDQPVKEILRIVFARQYQSRGDWPQWFMLEPYSEIQDTHSHGDVIVWPLKALCDYIEATNDLAFLDQPVAWRREDNFEKTSDKVPVRAHVDKLLATVRERFIPGTHLIRYGEGDWNDSLQPADPHMRDWMVSSWTVALLFQQLTRYTEVLRRAGRNGEADDLTELAGAMREDFDRHLVRDGTVAGYALFEPGREEPQLLLHPSDTRTGLRYSLLPMNRGIIAGLFDQEQAQHHLRLIREHLLFPDGVRLMDKPVAYHGGPEQVFRRAESSSFFGREIGLMYVHAHLRYAEAMAVLGEADALWEALQVANPIAVTDQLAHASPRQRNTYFSSSDAAFCDRYEASAEWQRVKAAEVAVDGGWRIYSSGPGLYVNALLSHAFGIGRRFGERKVEPLLPQRLGRVVLEMTVDGRPERWELSGA